MVVSTWPVSTRPRASRLTTLACARLLGLSTRKANRIIMSPAPRGSVCCLAHDLRPHRRPASHVHSRAAHRGIRARLIRSRRLAGEAWPAGPADARPGRLRYAAASASRKAGIPNRSPSRARAVTAIRAATAGWSRRYRTASAIRSGRCGGTSSPVSPGTTTSPTAFTAVATTGIPHTMASTTAVGSPS